MLWVLSPPKWPRLENTVQISWMLHRDCTYPALAVDQNFVMFKILDIYYLLSPAIFLLPPAIFLLLCWWHFIFSQHVSHYGLAQICYLHAASATLGACTLLWQGGLYALTIPRAIPAESLCSWQVQPSQTGPWGWPDEACIPVLQARGFGSGLTTWNCKKKNLVTETATRILTTTVCDGLPGQWQTGMEELCCCPICQLVWQVVTN